jgi:hypothetical protein
MKRLTLQEALNLLNRWANEVPTHIALGQPMGNTLIPDLSENGRDYTEAVPAPQTTPTLNPDCIPPPSHSKPAIASVHEAVRSMWPNGIPRSIPAKTRDDQIYAWQKQNNRMITKDRSIRRYLHEHPDAFERPLV